MSLRRDVSNAVVDNIDWDVVSVVNDNLGNQF
jgi:hypothetical protein